MLLQFWKKERLKYYLTNSVNKSFDGACENVSNIKLACKQEINAYGCVEIK
jgi:hypothetical protein